MSRIDNQSAIQAIMKMFDIDEDSATVLFEKNYYDKNNFLKLDHNSKNKYTVQKSYNDFDLTNSYLLLDVFSEKFTVKNIIDIMKLFKPSHPITFIGDNKYFLYQKNGIVDNNVDDSAPVTDIIISKKDFILAFS